ncbi:MAG: Ppx/GppA phosphatase family protein [Actinomycetota bacterium]
MNLAAIDIGTNSVRLLVSEYTTGKFSTLFRTMHITRIGENLSKDKLITPSAAERTLKTLKEYRDTVSRYGVKKYRALGTNALRKAENSSWFINYALRETGIKIEIISGQKEASLSFMGATKSLDGRKIKNACHDSKDVLVLDIGGGSTELIAGPCGKPRVVLSLELGCVTLTERYGADTDKMEDYCRRHLEARLDKISPYDLAVNIGLAGTITTLAAIDLKLEKYDRDRIHHHRLSKQNIEGIYSFLKDMDLEQRKKVKGLDPRRADIIVAGTVILLSVLNYLRHDYIIVSENDLLDGIIYSLIDF